MTTTTADVTRLMDNVRLAAPGVLDAAIRLEVFNTVTEFLQTTKAWTEDVDFTTAADQVNYEVSPDDSATIDSLVALVDVNDAPAGAVMSSEPGIITLTNTPTTAEVLTATISLSVIDPNDSNGDPRYPAWILTKYSLTLIAGVTSRLMMQPAKPYSNQQLGILNMRKFRAGCASARAEVRHENLYGGQRWRFPGFASGRQR